ncbi:MAG: hypothetical protein QOE70_1045 [Chthoniobacter sp.]|nr:hypothetical protein [Chthoniobacter sp.]
MTIPLREIEIDEVQPAGQQRPPTAGDDPLLASIARLMDTVFTIPGTNIRFGLDPVLGLLPGFGDTAGALVSTFIILQSARHGVPKIVLARMALNVLLNTAIGTVPVLGDVFSVYFKSNAINYRLLQQHAGARRISTARDWMFVLALLGGMFLVVTLIIVGAVTVIRQLLANGW